MVRRKQLVALVLAFVMVFQMLPVEALADAVWSIGARSNIDKGSTYYQVSFMVDDQKIASQLVKAGETVQQLPQDPTKEADIEKRIAYEFKGWQANGAAFTTETPVTADTQVMAEFNEIKIYRVTIKYQEFNKDEPFQTVERDYRNTDKLESIPSPSYYMGRVEDEDVKLYPDQNSVEIDPATLKGDQDIVVIYNQTNVKYTVVHCLEKLDGSGYEEIESETVDGVVGATVYGSAKEYPYAVFDHADSAVVKADGSTVVNVYYTRKNFTLNYDSQGGSYIKPQTAPYGTELDVYTVKTDGGEIVWTCKREEHTHSSKPSTPTESDFESGESSGRIVGCYQARRDWNNRRERWNNYRWERVCGKSKHTHSEGACYTTTPVITTYEPTPVKEGYHFAGWYADKDYTTKVDAKLTLTEDTTVYAKWEAGTANYQVVYFIENADNEDYSYLSSETRSGTVGQSTNLSAGRLNPTWGSLDRAGFNTSDPSIVNAEIVADGSSVAVVKYQRKEFTITFKKDGETYGTITDKYGTYIGKQWDDLCKDLNGTWVWDGSYTTAHQDIMPAANKTITFKENDSNTYTLTYYVEDPNGTVKDPRGGTKKFREYTTARYGRSGSWTFNEEYWLIEGYDRYYTTISDWQNGGTGSSKKDGNESFYYTLHEYPLVLQNGESEAYRKDIPYEQDITGVLAEQAVKLAPPVEGATFTGWYIDPTKTNINTATTMPQGLILYAGWELPVYDFTFDYTFQDETGNVGKKVEVKWNEKATAIEPPVRPGYTFDGWYADAEYKEVFDFNKPILENTRVYAKWIEDPITYTVTYLRVIMDGNGNQTYEELYQTKTVTRSASGQSFADGDEVSEEAIVNGLYRVGNMVKTMTLKRGVENNITFYYYPRAEATYTVRGVLLSDPDKTVFDDKTYEVGSNLDRVTVIAPRVGGYYATEAVGRLVISPLAEKNILTFYYVPYNERTFVIRYVDEDGKEIADRKVVAKIIGDSIQPEDHKAAVNGYVFDCIAKDDHQNLVAMAGSGEQQVIDLIYRPIGDLTITKVIEGLDSPNETLTFTVALASDSSEWKKLALAAWALTNGVSMDGDGKLQLTMRATQKSQSIKLEDLPAGTYTVTEGTVSKNSYIVNTSVKPDSSTATVEAGGTATVTFTNTYRPDDAVYTIHHYLDGTTTKVANDETGRALVGSTLTAKAAKNLYDDFKTATVSRFDKLESITIERDGQNVITVYYKIPLTIRANTAEYKYDGSVRTVQGTDGQGYTVDGLLADDRVTASVTYGDDQATEGKVNAGTYPVQVADGYTITKDGQPVGYYDVKTEDGQLIINKRAVVVTSGTAGKLYDGKALTNGEITIAGDGFVEADKPEIVATGSQTLVGSSENTIQITWTDPSVKDNYEVTEKPGELTVLDKEDDKQPEGELVVTKAHDDKVYQLGEVVTFTITATNIYQEAKDITLTEMKGVTFTAPTSENGSVTFKEVKPGESVTATAQYTIQEADITKQGFTNEVTAKVGEVTATATDTVKVEAVNKAYTLTKTLTNPPAKGYFTLGETAEFEIAVENTGNQALKDIQVIEELAGAKLAAGDGYTVNEDGTVATIESLRVSDTVKIKATYTIQKDDLGKKDLKNVVTGEGTTPGEAEIPVDDQVTVSGTKTWANDEGLTNEMRPESITVKLLADGTTIAELIVGQDSNWAYNFGILPKHTENGKAIVYSVEEVAVKGYTEKVDGYNITNTLNQFTVTYEATEGGSVSKDSETVRYNQNAEGSQATPASDYYFVNWTDADGKVVSTDQMWAPKNVTADATYTANFAKKTVITVTANDLKKVYNATPMTADNGQYVVSGLPEEYAVTVSTSVTPDIINVAQTNGGHIVGEVKVTKNGVDVTEQFTVNKQNGQLTILPRPVTITVEDDSKVFGEVDPEGYKGYTLEKAGENRGPVGEDLKDIGTGLTVIRTNTDEDAGTYSDVLTTKETAEELKEQYANYDFEVIPGDFEITKREISLSIKGAQETKVYNGEEQMVVDYAVNLESGELPANVAVEDLVWLAEGNEAKAAQRDVIRMETEGVYGQTDMGLTEKSFVWNDNYDVTITKVEDGWIQITPRTVTITANSAEYSYDGTAKTAIVDGKLYTIDGLLGGHSEQDVAVKYDGEDSQTDAGKYEAVASGARIVANDSTDVTDNYNITTVPGTLTITKDQTAITITSADGEWVYDGDEHSKPEYTVTYGGQTLTADEGSKGLVFTLPNGVDKLTVTPTASVTNVAESGKENTFNYELLGAANYGTPVTTNYGTLTITTRPVTMTSATADKLYDGTQLTDDTVTESKGEKEGFVDGQGATYNVTGTQTLVGSSENKFTYELKDGTDVGNYDITTVNGTLTVRDEKKDDEQPIDSLVVTKGHTGSDFALNSTVEFTITAKNIYEEARTITLTEQEGVTFTEAKNGAISDDKRTATFANVAPGAEVTATATHTITEDDILAKTYVNTVSAAVDGKSYTAEDRVTPAAQNPSYTLEKQLVEQPQKGYYTLGETAKFTITVTNDGNLALKDVSVEEKLDGAVIDKGEGYIVEDNAATITELPVGETVTIHAHYTIQATDLGKKTVTNTVVSGNKQAKADFKVDDARSVEGVKTWADDENAYGTRPESIEVSLYRKVGEGEAQQYGEAQTVKADSRWAYSFNNLPAHTEADEEFTYFVREAPVTGYDTAYSDGGITNTLKQFKVTYQYTNTPEGASALPEEKTYKYGQTVSVADDASAPGYTFSGWSADRATIENGEFVMPESDVVITGSFTAKKDTAYRVEYYLENLVGDGFDLKETQNLTGTTDTLAKAEVKSFTGFTFDKDNTNNKLEGTIAGDGSLVLKVYYTRNSYEVTYEYTGKVPAGASELPVERTYKYGAAIEVAKAAEAAGYTFSGWSTENATVADGKFTMPENDVKFTGSFARDYVNHDFTVEPYDDIYDGQTHGVTVEDTIAGEDVVEYAITANATEWSQVPPVYQDVNLVDDKVASYPVYVRVTNSVDGSQRIKESSVTIRPATLTIETLSDSKVYDGTALTAAGTITGFVNNETATFNTTGSQTKVGDSENTYSLEWDGTAKKSNYQLTEKIGTLTVTEYAEEIVVTTTGGTFVYDGAKHGATVSVSELPKGYTLETATSNANETNVTNGKVTAKCDTLVIRNAAGEDVTTKLNIRYVNGELEITPRPVTITVNQKGVEFNRQPQTVVKDGKEYAVETQNGERGLLSGHTETLKVVYGEDKAENKSLVGEYLADVTRDASDKPMVTISDGTADQTSNYAIEVVTGKLTISGEPVEPGKTVASTPETAEGYKLGDQIEFTIKVENITNQELTGITVTDPTAEIVAGEGYTVADNTATIATLASGAIVNVKALHTVTSDDILKGSYENTATIRMPDDKTFQPSAKTEDISPVDTTLTVVKTTTSTPDNGTAYALGETITYQIAVTNDGNVPYYNVEVKDDLTGDAWKIDVLNPGETQTYTASYKVTEKDILAGTVVNKATATADPVEDPDDPDQPKQPEDGDQEENPTDPKNGHLTVVKTTTSTPANGTAYALGEEITYGITVTNDGNLTIENITVTDTIEGLDGVELGQIASLEPGASENYTYRHEVTEADILAGRVVNKATATGSSPDPEKPEPGVEPGKEEDPTDPKNGHLTVVKTTTSTPANSTAYALGEEITYDITVTNDGNLTIENITVTDTIEGLDGVELGQIASLEPGASTNYTYRHEVTEADILAGRVVNNATATGSSPDPEKPEPGVVPGKEEDPTDPKNGHLTVTKTTTSTPANGTAYALGEEITYDITVTNDGNLTVTGIDVTDSLSTAEGQIIGRIERLEPGETAVVPFTYVVTGADLTAGSVLNSAGAIAPNPDPEADPETPDVPVEPGEVEVPVLNQLSLRVNYWYDGVGGEAAAASYTGTYAYGQGYNVVSPRIIGYTANLMNAVGTMTQNLTVDVVYARNAHTLTVQYRFMDGTVAAADYVAQNLGYGDEYNVLSPALAGFTSNMANVAGQMPDNSVVLTVYYAAVPQPPQVDEEPQPAFVDIDEYGVPLGLNNVVMNVGDCFE